MKLNKSSSYVLVALLRGCVNSAEVIKLLQNVELRTIQRALVRLTELRLIIQDGPSNDPTYRVNYSELVNFAIDERVLHDEKRPESLFNHDFLTWLQNLAPSETETYLGSKIVANRQPMSPRDLEYLTIELSWKSSALEGNTYSLLDTQLLLTEGVRAKHKTEFETQMILNHKDAISFIMENRAIFSNTITFAAIEELHRIIARNLGIDAGVRRRIIKISASNYQPLAAPAKIREAADDILTVINTQKNPLTKSLLALSLIPYLQIFEDGNKRTGRMLANAILISSVGHGFSLRKIEARELALAYLAFYEFNSLHGLRNILINSLKDSGTAVKDRS